jgi:predicted RNase H-like HicB family nuclease
MKAYVGQHVATGKFYALSQLPACTQWGDTPTEAWDRLREYLERYYGLTLTGYEPFPGPEEEGTP